MHSLPAPLPLGETDAFHFLHPYADPTGVALRVVPGPMQTDLLPDAAVPVLELTGLAAAVGHASLSRFWTPRW